MTLNFSQSSNKPKNKYDFQEFLFRKIKEIRLSTAFSIPDVRWKTENKKCNKKYIIFYHLNTRGQNLLSETSTVSRRKIDKRFQTEFKNKQIVDHSDLKEAKNKMTIKLVIWYRFGTAETNVLLEIGVTEI